MTPDPILSEREVNKFCNAPGRAGRGGLAVYDSHEALRARAETAERTAADRMAWIHDAHPVLIERLERAERAEARVAALTEALDTAVGMLDGFVEHVADAWAPQHEHMFRGALADLHDMLGDR